MKHALVAALTVAVALLFAPVAAADQYDFISELDGKGIPYADSAQMVDLGKQVCSRLRYGFAPTAVNPGDRPAGEPVGKAGYEGIEANIIVVAAARNLCPDQLERTLAG